MFYLIYNNDNIINIMNNEAIHLVDQLLIFISRNAIFVKWLWRKRSG